MKTENVADRRFAYLVAHLIGYALGLRSIDIMAPDRGTKTVAKGRQLAMYLAHVSLGWSIARVAAAFERDRSTVAHACQIVEHKRDDDAFDLWMNEMEESLLRVVPLARSAA